MPFAEYHERPDPACLYSLLHRLESPTEGMRLIAHVCIEASKVSSVSKMAPFPLQIKYSLILCPLQSACRYARNLEQTIRVKSPSASLISLPLLFSTFHFQSLRDQALAGRAPLLDMALQSSLKPCLHYIEYLAGFLDPPASLPPDLLAICPDASSIARRLLLCLYLRRPGLLYALKSSIARSFLRTPSASESIPDCFEQKEVRLSIYAEIRRVVDGQWGLR